MSAGQFMSLRVKLTILLFAIVIFVAALRALDLPHNQVAMVGDSLRKDCEPARNLGMRSIWLRGAHPGTGEHPQAQEAAALADHSIDALEELKDLKW